MKSNSPLDLVLFVCYKQTLPFISGSRNVFYKNKNQNKHFNNKMYLLNLMRKTTKHLYIWRKDLNISQIQEEITR